MEKQNDFIQIRIGGNIDDFVSSIKKIKGSKNDITVNGDVLRIPYSGDKTFTQIIDASVKSKCPLYEMERDSVTMDNVYLDVVK